MASLQCTLLAEYDDAKGSKVWIYKHGEGSPLSLPATAIPPRAPNSLIVD
jgi:hypothetical protein